MTRAPFGPLELDVPEAWSDQSVLTFVGKPLAPSTPTVGATKEIRPTVIVRYVRISDSGLDLDAYAALQERLLTEHTPCCPRAQWPSSTFGSFRT